MEKNRDDDDGDEPTKHPRRTVSSKWRLSLFRAVILNLCKTAAW